MYDVNDLVWRLCSLLSSTSDVFKRSFDSRFRCALSAPSFACSPTTPQMINFTSGERQENLLDSLNEHNSLRDSSKGLSSRFRWKSRNRRGNLCNHGKNVLLAVGDRL